MKNIATPNTMATRKIKAYAVMRPNNKPWGVICAPAHMFGTDLHAYAIFARKSDAERYCFGGKYEVSPVTITLPAKKKKK